MEPENNIYLAIMIINNHCAKAAVVVLPSSRRGTGARLILWDEVLCVYP